MKLTYKIEDKFNELCIYSNKKRKFIYFKSNNCYILNKKEGTTINGVNMLRFNESTNLRKYYKLVNYSNSTDIWKHLC